MLYTAMLDFVIIKTFLGAFSDNAFGISLTQKLSLIAIGSNLIDNLNLEELKNVIAHELSHIKHNHYIKGLITSSTIVASNLPLIMKIALIAFISRIHEKEADTSAVLHTKTPKQLISALEKIDSLIDNTLEKTNNSELTKEEEELQKIMKQNIEKYVKPIAPFFELFMSHPRLSTRKSYLLQYTQ